MNRLRHEKDLKNRRQHKDIRNLLRLNKEIKETKRNR